MKVDDALVSRNLLYLYFDLSDSIIFLGEDTLQILICKKERIKESERKGFLKYIEKIFKYCIILDKLTFKSMRKCENAFTEFL